MLKFAWDPAKAAANARKHGVTFAEAQTVFHDEFAIQFFDDAHADLEDRFLLLGLSALANLLLVCHCERAGGHTIRIISARKATARESAHYAKVSP
ncbi:MAG: BrnT family toxin [Proteobacteria bacterium]|nr:BrnT family toxin [Pseudomonadota bacterium]MBS0463078.1 BrnT family toxin [Pseudomonadota bacterium]MBS0463789.1 BrnT family toxin [Pseudomonadota bacterium]